jgi:hypothetical protein
MPWEETMRGFALTVAMLVTAVPAQAGWQYYACPSDNFASQFPDVPKMETIKYSMPRHKDALSARTYTTTVDNVVFRMLVADYSDRIPDGASILEEAMFQHTESDDHGLRNGKIIGNDTARIEPVPRGATFGRRITMDMPDGGGRNLTNFYFRDGKLYEQSVTILPANGDYTTPDGSRFVESLLFNLPRLNDEYAREDNKMPLNIPGCGTTLQPFNFK